MRKLLLLAAFTASLTFAGTAAASGLVPPSPMLLPGDVAAASVKADPDTWLVGARPGAASARVAAAAGATRVNAAGWQVARPHARAFAAALKARGLLTYAEPNRYSSFHQAPRAVPDDPLSAAIPWRDYAVDPTLAPPVVGPDSPVLALVDAKADVTNPEFTAGNLVSLDGESVTVDHGTATASVASAPVNGIGMVGVWPGMRAINVPLPADQITCSDSSKGIARAVAAGAAVINMSYGSPSFCQTEFDALEAAVRAGINLVAAAGNEFDQGNPLEFPASLPHVLTVGASTPDDQSAVFSNENAAMDLVAPGVDIVAAMPVALDTVDGTQDGFEIVSGTSFSAPMVAAATAWVRQARPDLTVDQVAQVIRLSARDIGDPGYDRSTGFGALNMGGTTGALARPAPVADPLEPNEDIAFVDGRAFGKAAAPIVTPTKRKTSFKALIDLYEDPGDVYRLRVGKHRTSTISVKPAFGNSDVELYSGAAKGVGIKRHRLARSRHSGQHTDTVRARNTTGHTRTFYVRVYVRTGQKTLDAGYTLKAR